MAFLKAHAIDPFECAVWNHAAENDWTRLCDAPAVLLRDRDFMVRAIKADSRALKFASAELKSDRMVVLDAVRRDGEVLEYASDGIRDDREVLMEAVRHTGVALRHARTRNLHDRELVAEAVRQDWRALAFASENCRLDRSIVLEAVKQDGRALAFASEEFWSDREVVIEAVRSSRGQALRWAATELMNDPTLRQIAAESGLQVVSESQRCWWPRMHADQSTTVLPDRGFVKTGYQRYREPLETMEW
jgi:hypothetical protein